MKTRHGVQKMDNPEVRNVNGIGFRGESADPDSYEFISEISGQKVPRSRTGGGTKNHTFGEPGKVIRMVSDPTTGAFIPAGEMEAPDSVKYSTNSPAFLQRKYEERVAAMRAKAAGNTTQAVPVEVATESPSESPLGPLGVESDEASVEYPGDPLVMESQGSPDQLSMFAEGRASTGIGMADVAMPRNESAMKDMSIEYIEVDIEFTSGRIKAKYLDVVDTNRYTLCFYNEGDPVFEPNIAKDDSASFCILKDGVRTGRLVHLGDEAKVPGTNIKLYIFHKLEE